MNLKEKISVGRGAGGLLRKIGRVLAILLMVGIITGCILACVATVYVTRFMKAGDALSLDNLSMKYTTILYYLDENGNSQELQRLQTLENRIWVDYADIPQHMIDALIAIEDQRFKNHHGVDWKRTTSAFVNLFIPLYKTGQGGSTITQQLVKNITGENEGTVERKIREIFRALKLEQDYSKEQILEAYLNTVYYSNNCYGVQAAANTYFGKDVSELSVAESASIIGITQYPGKWDPFVNPEKNKNRQEDVLHAMFTQKKLTEAEYEAALAEPLNFQKNQVAERVAPVYSYFVDRVIEEVIKDLQDKKGITYEEAQQMVNSSGLRIHTTVDKKVQDIVTDFYAHQENFPAVYNETYPQSAAVILEPNGAVKALAGAVGEKKGMREFDRATRAQRHPGSAIKPLTAYLQGFENDIIFWSTKMDDNPFAYNGGLGPVNYDGHYLGMITIDKAIQQSRNPIPVKLVEMVTPRRCFDFLRDKLNFYSLVEHETDANGNTYSDIDLSPMALGGMVRGVTPLEMAGGYQIYANGGYFTTPYTYTDVEDAEGNVILDKETAHRRAISAETATIMNRLLQRVTTLGTGTSAKFGAMPVAGKTGTSSENYDQWFMGVTPYYVTAIWMGYDEHQKISYQWYPPPLVYKSLMGKVHEGLEVKEFPIWGDVAQKDYCADSGELAIAGCPVGGTGWYKAENLPPECTFHTSMTESVNLDTKKSTGNGARPKNSSSNNSSSKAPKPGWHYSESGLLVPDRD